MQMLLDKSILGRDSDCQQEVIVSFYDVRISMVNLSEYLRTGNDCMHILPQSEVPSERLSYFF